FGHNIHFHDFISPIDGVTSSTFFIPTGGETDPDQYYRIVLTVTDSQGLQTTVFRDVRPLLATFTLASTLPRTTLLLDGSPVPAGTTTTGVVGMVRTIEAPATQVINGVTYPFIGWSDGGAPQHTINTSATPTLYTATYGPGQLSNGFEQDL